MGTIRLTGMALLLATAAPAFAQTAESTAAVTQPEDEGEEIVVTGFRGSLREAINVKRNANAVVDAISAEDIGKFPDRNVAESLSHIPGVSIDRRFGEGEKVAILGTDPALNRMLLDGHALASADWGGNDNDPTSRTFNYSLLAPELVDRLEVYKSPESRLEEGSLGGTVIVRTRRPLELDANSVFASAGYIYNDRSEKGNPRASGLYSWKNDAETFGVLVAATYDRQDIVRAGVEFFGYDNPNGTSGSPFLTTNAAGQRVLRNPNAVITGGTIADLDRAASPFGINYAYFQQQRERFSLSGTVQARPTDSLTLTLNALRIDGNYNNYSQAMYTIPGAWTGDVLQSATIRDGVVTDATFGAANSQSAQVDTLVRSTDLVTDNINFFADWESPGGATVTFLGGWSRAVGGRNPEYLFNVQTRSPFSYSFDRNSANVNFTGDITNSANFFTNPNNALQTIEGQPVIVNGRQLNGAQIGGQDFSRVTDRDIYGGYDAVIPVGLGPFTQILVGGRYTDHFNRNDARGINTYLTSSLLGSQLGVDVGVTPDGVFSGTGGGGNATRFINLSRQAVIDILDNAINTPVFEKLNNSFRVSERIVANYVQANFDAGGLRGNIGGRLVYTNNLSEYALTLFDPNATTPPAPTPARVSNDYLRFLPSLNIAYEAGNDIIMRGAVAKVISRPRYNELAGSFSQNDVTRDAGGGNPDLRPYESVNYQATLEYYPAPGALLALELFRRDISNYILTTTTPNVTLFNTLTQRFEAGYNVSQPINAGKATVNGVLVSGQAELWGGFGIQANYAYQDSTTEVEDAAGGALNLPYLSRHTVNVIPYFESGPVQARLSYNYRSSYFRVIGRLGSQEMVAPYNQLDFSASVAINEALTLTVNAQNLLDETYRQYNGTPDRPTAFYKNGRTFQAGINVRF